MANGTPPLWLNFDEACVPKGEGGAVGAVVGRLWWPTAEEPLDAFAGKYKKTCLSLLLTVAAEADVQATLPQIFWATMPLSQWALLACKGQVLRSFGGNDLLGTLGQL